MYIDVLIILNLLVDFLLLISADRLCGYPVRFKRTILAALLGGIYAGICVLPGCQWLGGFFGRILSLGIISGIAFGFCRTALRRSMMFVLLSMALGGIALGIGNCNFGTILLSAGGIVAMCVIGLSGRIGTEYIPIIIRHSQEMVRFYALRDTGNTLTDPISGQQVMVASADLGTRLLGLSEEELNDPVGSIRKIGGARLIPFQSVGTSGGLLLAQRFDDVTIGSRRGSCLIAFAPHKLGVGEPYDALVGGAL